MVVLCTKHGIKPIVFVELDFAQIQLALVRLIMIVVVMKDVLLMYFVLAGFLKFVFQMLAKKIIPNVILT